MTAGVPPASPLRAGPREWLGLAVLTLTTLLLALTAALLLALAVVAVTVLRHVRPTGVDTGKPLDGENRSTAIR